MAHQLSEQSAYEAATTPTMTLTQVLQAIVWIAIGGAIGLECGTLLRAFALSTNSPLLGAWAVGILGWMFGTLYLIVTIILVWCFDKPLFVPNWWIAAGCFTITGGLAIGYVA